jgi:hypothetical protein
MILNTTYINEIMKYLPTEQKEVRTKVFLFYTKYLPTLRTKCVININGEMKNNYGEQENDFNYIIKMYKKYNKFGFIIKVLKVNYITNEIKDIIKNDPNIKKLTYTGRFSGYFTFRRGDYLYYLNTLKIEDKNYIKYFPSDVKDLIETYGINVIIGNKCYDDSYCGQYFHVYSYGLNPENYQQTGSSNFSIIDINNSTLNNYDNIT